ncbi:MAG: hypothetical protein ACYTXY_12055 [Nostoc sp.]
MKTVQHLTCGCQYFVKPLNAGVTKLNCCNHGDAYGWLRLRICYFGELICYFGELICYIGDRICYIGELICYFGELICYFGDRICYIVELICYFGDAYGGLRQPICYIGELICYFGLSITRSTGVSRLKCCKKIVGWVEVSQPNLVS